MGQKITGASPAHRRGSGGDTVPKMGGGEREGQGEISGRLSECCKMLKKQDRDESLEAERAKWVSESQWHEINGGQP